MTYTPPSFKADAFTCPHCSVYAHMDWMPLSFMAGPGFVETAFYQARCSHCKKPTCWVSFDGGHGVISWPSSISSAPFPHASMPDDVKTDYEEARDIVARSPRSASALLRLAIQKLCIDLKCEGGNLNDHIGWLVKQGLPVTIQQALDTVRVTGNNAVHPGELRVEDNPEIAQALFGLVNIIVQDRIAQPAQIAELYGKMPAGAKAAIEKRDS